MKDRILNFLNNQQLSSAKFAEEIGVQPSSISHILSGRNKPSFDFIQKILTRYSEVNPDWLILGKGEMFRDIKQGDLFVSDKHTLDSDTYINAQTTNINDTGKDEIKPEFKAGLIEKVLIFYSDNTFKEYIPK